MAPLITKFSESILFAIDIGWGDAEWQTKTLISVALSKVRFWSSLCDTLAIIILFLSAKALPMRWAQVMSILLASGTRISLETKFLHTEAVSSPFLSLHVFPFVLTITLSLMLLARKSIISDCFLVILDSALINPLIMILFSSTSESILAFICAISVPVWSAWSSSTNTRWSILSILELARAVFLSIFFKHSPHNWVNTLRCLWALYDIVKRFWLTSIYRIITICRR